MIYPSEYSSYFSTRVYGGALYSRRVSHSLKCVNCVFIDNLVLIKENKEKGFAGAIYLTNDTFDSCTFKDNSAYNGGDIRFDQIINTCLIITRCSFQIGLSKKQKIISMIHICTSSNLSIPNLFTYNKVETFLLICLMVKLNQVHQHLNSNSIKIAWHHLIKHSKNYCYSMKTV